MKNRYEVLGGIMNKVFTKLMVLVLVLVLIMSTVACSPGKSGGDGSEKITIKFLHKWPQEENAKFFEEIVKEFEAQNKNVDIVIEAVGDEPIKDKLRVLLGANESVDVFFSWSGEFAKKFIRSGNVLDLTPYLDKSPKWRDSIMKAGTEPFSADGKVYGIPYRINCKLFVYNKKIFDENGLKAPKDWDEFLTVLDTLKQKDITPIGFGNIYPWAGCHYITGLNQKYVAQEVRAKDYLQESGEFTDPGYVEALKKLKELNDKGYFNKGVNSTEHNMANEMFFGGKVAMTYVELEELADVQDKMKDDWGIFVMPAIKDGKGNQNFITGAPDGFMVSSKTKHPEMAVKFLEFLTNEANSKKMVETLGWPSPVKGAVTKENSLPKLAEGLELITKAEGMALWLDTDIDIRISDVYLPGIQEVLNGDKTPEDLMKEVQEKAAEVKKEFKK